MSQEREASEEEPLLVYDQQCPVCDRYCRSLQAANARPLRLVNARNHRVIMREIDARGIDIDQNIVLKVGSELYVGAEAIHRLATTSTTTSLFSRLNNWTFRSKRRAEILYPLLRAGRNLLLRLLGRTKINNLKLPNNERF